MQITIDISDDQVQIFQSKKERVSSEIADVSDYIVSELNGFIASSVNDENQTAQRLIIKKLWDVAGEIASEDIATIKTLATKAEDAKIAAADAAAIADVPVDA